MAVASDVPRLQREKDFHDERFADDSARRATQKYYEAVDEGPAFYARRLRESAGTGAVLEYGCGTGSSAFGLALGGATVTGIDISPVAIESAEREAHRQECADQTTFVEANAEHTGLPETSFDLICGSGILHHLDLDAAAAEVARLMKPAGVAIFLEPMGHNALINWYRRRTPEMRSVDEHPLLRADLDDLAERFTVTANYFGLLSIASAFVGRVPVIGNGLTRLLAAFDAALLRVGPLQKFAWLVVLELRARPGTS